MDKGSYYHEDFLRGHPELVDNIIISDDTDKKGEKDEDGDGDVTMKDSSPNAADSPSSPSVAQQPDQPSPQLPAVSEEVLNFLSFTGTSDTRVATHYLEMSGNNSLEMAVSLYMDHGQPSPAALGLDPLPLPVAAGAAAASGASAMGAAAASSSGKKSEGDDDDDDSDNEEEEEEEEEQDFYKLPPMPSILLPVPVKKKKEDRKVLPAERIVETALREYNAFRIIRRALLHWIDQRRKGGGGILVNAKSNQQTPHQHTQQLQYNNAAPAASGTSHFLFASLSHSSLPVRRAAARMIMHNLHRIQQRQKMTKKEDEDGEGKEEKDDSSSKSKSVAVVRNSGQGLQEVLVILLHSLMFGELPYEQQQQSSQCNTLQQHQMMIPRTKNQAEGGDPALQIMGMLSSLVCDGGYSNIIVSDEVKDVLRENPTFGVAARLSGLGITMGHAGGDEVEENILAKSLLNELSSDSIELFVAAGGLRWACGSIVRLVHMLIHGPTIGNGNDNNASATYLMMSAGSDSDGNHSSPNHHHHGGQVEQIENITSRTIQTRLMLLIDLVYRLVLFGSVPAAVDKNTSLSVTAAIDGGSGDGKGSKKTTTGKDGSSKEARRSNQSSSSGRGGIAASEAETSRTSAHHALRESIRASIGNPPLSGGRARLSGHGGSLANLPSSSGGGGGGGGGDSGASSSILDENLQRKDRRRATLERVHKLFWSSTLPAAVCLPSMMNTGELTLSADLTTSNEDTVAAFGELTPLACLIASYEILRSRPLSHSTLSTNYQLRTFEKGIATLGRIVDPTANNPVVVVDGELPWGLAGILEKASKQANESSSKKLSSRKRGRSLSHDSHNRSTRSSTSNADANNRVNRPSSIRPAKRSRTSSNNVASLLERLTQAESAAAGTSSSGGGGGAGGASSRSAARAALDSAVAAASLRAAGANRLSGGAAEGGAAGNRGSGSSSIFADRYRSAVESMMRSSPGAGVASAAAASRTDRDGSLNRILGLASSAERNARSAAARDANLSRLLASGTTVASPNLSASNRSSLRRAAGEAAEEWRVLHELPEGGDVMDDAMDVELADMDIINDNEGEGGEMDDDEANDDNNNHDDDVSVDSDAESAMEDIVDIDGNNPGCVGNSDNHDDEDSENDEYNEETDEDAYDTSQFDDAVINLDEIDPLPDTTHQHQSHGHSQRNPHRHSTSRNPTVSRMNSGGSSAETSSSPLELALKKREREQAFLCAAMSILEAQYPQLLVKKNGLLVDGARQQNMFANRSSNRLSIFTSPAAHITPQLLTSSAEQSLLKNLCNIVKPPRKPLNLKIFLRRAPTQEEFFRGNLTKNPIGLSSLRAAGSSSGGGGGGDDRRSSSGGSKNDEPLVSDLRLHIAKDLQMEDSAELLELLVANKILDMNLKLRVVQQVLWKKYVEENATSASSAGVAGAGPSHQMISTGNGLSMIFSSSGLVAARSRASAGGGGSTVADDNAILASFPPMVVTYRLAGVDGEATEDNVEAEDLEDPEAPSAANSTPAAIEKRMEKEFGITRMLTQHQGVAVLLASVQGTISDLLRRIRRDEVARRRILRNVSGAKVPSTADNNEDGNTTREQLAKSQPCPGLILLRLCANLSDNRKKMLANRAPTLLLRILLDILNAMNRSSDDGNRKGRQRSSTIDFSSHSSMDVDDPGDGAAMPSSTRNRVHHVEGNPTTEALQEIIEMLASDISADISGETKSLSSNNKAMRKSLKKSSGSLVNLAEGNEPAVGQQDEDRTLPLVLKSLHSTDLSPPLRKVIAKLLPFLTYGQVSQSRELASYFNRYINVDRLGIVESPSDDAQPGHVLMITFVDTAINLPPVSVCDNLRSELISNGFVKSVRAFLLENAPSQPPPWSPALYSKSCKKLTEKKTSELKEEWRSYFDRPGLSSAFKILTGLCSGHDATQLLLSDVKEFEDIEEEGAMNENQGLNLLTLCHWLESTSDNTESNIQNSNGILAETFLDALKEDNELSSKKIDAIRKTLRDRKRELAEERRNKALVGMSAFGTLAGSAVSNAASSSTQGGNAGSMFGGLFSSLLAPPAAASSSSSSQQRTTRASAAKESASAQPKAKPSWMAEMEAMADEAGATCAVCQEGRTLQPSELLGLYAYLKKVSIPTNQGGGKGDIDGTMLLLSLPMSFPNALAGSTDMETLFNKARSAANALEGSSHALSAVSASVSSMSGSSSSSGRNNYYVTTVSAGNAIHCSCHKRAKTADRNHPKAPKSEWEGASLRNSRVTCNVILPLVSSKNNEVPLIKVESALAEYNAIATNTLGVRPKSTLWNCLHDLRFLLLRMAHGESLGADSGGGSSSSNFLLLLYQLYSADMFAQNAEHEESIEVSRHARGLSAGFFVGADIIDDVSFDRTTARSRKLEKGVADAAPMSALLSILFHNMDDKTASGSKKTHDLSGSNENNKQMPSPTRQWELNKSRFLAGLIRCAGRRHSLGVTDSGCVTSRGISTGRSKNVEKARSFLEWSNDSRASSSSSMIEEYSTDLRPMITLYAVFDQLSKEFVVNNNDESTEESSERLAAKLDSCYKADNIQELLRVAGINVGSDVICKYFEKGATS